MRHEWKVTSKIEDPTHTIECRACGESVTLGEEQRNTEDIQRTWTEQGSGGTGGGACSRT